MTDEQRERRIYHHLYVDSKSPLENAERITDLEELAADMWAWWFVCCWDCERRDDYCGFGPDRECHYEREIHDRIKELEVPL